MYILQNRIAWQSSKVNFLQGRLCESASLGRVDNRVGACSQVETDTWSDDAAGMSGYWNDAVSLYMKSCIVEMGLRLGPPRRHWARAAVGRLIPLLRYRELPANTNFRHINISSLCCFISTALTSSKGIAAVIQITTYWDHRSTVYTSVQCTRGNLELPSVHAGHCIILSRVSTLTRDIGIANLSVCLSVRPWRSGIRWKGLTYCHRFFHPHSSFITIKQLY